MDAIATHPTKASGELEQKSPPDRRREILTYQAARGQQQPYRASAGVSRIDGVAHLPPAFDHCAVGAASFRDSILVVGAGGRTGRYVLRYLCAASVPVIACVRSADRLASEASLASAEVVCADVGQPHSFAPLIERAAHVIYLAGGDRRGLSPGAWQLEVEGLSACLELARRAGLPGRWISVGYSGPNKRSGASWAEIRWRELKLAADEVIAASGVNYFVVRTGRLTAPVDIHPRVSMTQDSAAADAALPCNVLAFLLTGAALSGATDRSQATVRFDPHGLTLQSAVHAFRWLRKDGVIVRTANLASHA